MSVYLGKLHKVLEFCCYGLKEENQNRCVQEMIQEMLKLLHKLSFFRSDCARIQQD